MRRGNAFGRVCLSVSMSVCPVPGLFLESTLTHKLHFRCAGTPSQYLGHVRMSRSPGQGQGHSSKKRDIHTDLRVVHLRLKGKLVSFIIDINLTLSPPIPSRLYTLPYWSNPPFLISDIRALWRSGLSARAPECQKLKMTG